jgi:hypothetical protein
LLSVLMYYLDLMCSCCRRCHCRCHHCHLLVDCCVSPPLPLFPLPLPTSTKLLLAAGVIATCPRCCNRCPCSFRCHCCLFFRQR